MRDTQLVFAEGIMGAGKFTAAWFLTEQLQRHGIAARFILAFLEPPDRSGVRPAVRLLGRPRARSWHTC